VIFNVKSYFQLLYYEQYYDHETSVNNVIVFLTGQSQLTVYVKENFQE